MLVAPQGGFWSLLTSPMGALQVEVASHDRGEVVDRREVCIIGGRMLARSEEKSKFLRGLYGRRMAAETEGDHLHSELHDAREALAHERTEAAGARRELGQFSKALLEECRITKSLKTRMSKLESLLATANSAKDAAVATKETAQSEVTHLQGERDQAREELDSARRDAAHDQEARAKAEEDLRVLMASAAEL